MKIQFYKYQATGNDFVILDDRDGRYDQLGQKEISVICDRRFGIGADGLIMLKNKGGYDFEMKYFNADGAIGSMCGNGSRCIVDFAMSRGISKQRYHFLTFDGDHFATVADGLVSVLMSPVSNVKVMKDATILDTGSPHYVRQVDNVANMDVVDEGRAIRNSAPYKEKGINVNFVQKISPHSIYVRTYERGVENETLSCGTGVTASAIAFAGPEDVKSEFAIETKGGKLRVSYLKKGTDFVDVWLTGPAKLVFSGEINI